MRPARMTAGCHRARLDNNTRDNSRTVAGEKPSMRHRDFSRRAGCAACVLLFGLLAWRADAAGTPPTPLEESAYEELSSLADISRFLVALAHTDRRAQHIVLGKSAGGRPLDALLISQNPDALYRGDPPAGRLRVMIGGGQHGGEPSGTEAILMLARDLLSDPTQTLLADIEFILLPVENPDGREARRRLNDDGADFSADFVALTQPETRALVDALVRWQPHVFVDLHESAVYKPKTLARHGYMTDFEAQFEVANNGNIDSGVAELNRERIRPAILSELQRRGLRATEYIREITDPNQKITHGGLTVRNARNRAGMTGALSLIIENRLDPSTGSYPTPHNIAERTAKQLLSVDVLLAVCRARRQEIMARTRAARTAWRKANAGENVFLSTTYETAPGKETISIELRRIEDGQLETRSFPYLGRIVNSTELALPAAYAITAHHEHINTVLKRQHIKSVVLHQRRQCRATVQRVLARQPVRPRFGHGTFRTGVEERESVVTLPAGTHWITLRQPAQRLIPLLLEPRSSSSLFDHADFASLVIPGEDFFILRINNSCGQGNDG